MDWVDTSGPGLRNNRGTRLKVQEEYGDCAVYAHAAKYCLATAQFVQRTRLYPNAHPDGLNELHRLNKRLIITVGHGTGNSCNVLTTGLQSLCSVLFSLLMHTIVGWKDCRQNKILVTRVCNGTSNACVSTCVSTCASALMPVRSLSDSLTRLIAE